MALPTVTLNEQTILLGTVISGTDLLSFADDDGDFVTKIRVRDNNSSVDSSYLINNGIVVPPNSWVEILTANLNTLILNPGTSIQANNYEFQAFSNNEWGPIANEFIYSVVENNTKPIVVAEDVSVVQSESVNLADYISAYDPDGFPIKRWRIFDSNPGPTSARIFVDGLGELAAGQWHYLWPEQLQNARFIAAHAAPNNDPIYLRAFDRNDGMGAEGQGLWSDPVNINGFTTVNFNRPVGIPTEFNIATEETVGITELFGWTDADGNTLKRARFFDTSTHFWSGSLREFGVPIPGGQWVEFSVAELANVDWLSSQRSFNEQVRFQVFDGNHWSDVQTFRVRTNEKPIIGVAEDYSIEQQLEFVDISNLIVKIDDGPVYTKYEIYDANTDITSGDFRLGATVLSAGQVHEINTQDFFDLEFKTGVYETRSVDDVYVRAYNGTFWSDWTRHTIRTEPEYLDSLAAASWLNFRPRENGTLPMTFSFMQIYPTYGGAIEEEFVRPWPELREFTRQAFLRLEEVLNIDFEEVPDSVNGQFGRGGDIRIGTTCNGTDNAAAFAFFPGPDEINGDIWLDRWDMGASATYFTNAQDPPCGHPTEDETPPGFLIPPDAWDKGSVNYAIFIHELGHAMGLKHPHDGDPRLPAATDSGFFTHMSYNGASSPEWGQQLYDLAALQSIYGANTTYNNGDTVYDSSYWRGSFNVVDAIWDAGGNDTIDASDQITSATFDLRPGGFNMLGQTGSISIAFGVEMENAIGTQFADSFTGNELANRLVGGGGNDTFEGYGGDDMLMGGAGNDTYTYKMFDGNDTINEDFGAGRDTIQLGLFLEVDDFATDVRLTRRNFDMIIDFTVDEGISRGSITIEGQGFGKNRVETLDFMGTPVDLRFAFNAITSPGQQFQIDLGNSQQYGFGVTPVVA